MTPTATGRPAFDMPGGEGGKASRARPIDFERLKRQTMDDRELEQQVLSLFVQQATNIAGQIASAAPKERIRMAHLLKGSSRSVGAFPVASCAEEVEEKPEDMARVRRLQRRIAEVAEVVAAISR